MRKLLLVVFSILAINAQGQSLTEGYKDIVLNDVP